MYFKFGGTLSPEFVKRMPSNGHVMKSNLMIMQKTYLPCTFCRYIIQHMICNSTDIIMIMLDRPTRRVVGRVSGENAGVTKCR